MAHKKYDISKEFLKKKYLVEKKNTYQIAEELGCKSETVRLNLIKFGIPRRSFNKCKIGIKQSEQQIKNRVLKLRGKKRTEAQRLVLLECLKLRKPGFRKRVGLKLKALWKNPEWRSKMVAIRRKQMTPEVIAKIAKQLNKREKSSLEIKLENICNKYRIPFKYCGQGSFPIAGRYPDFVCKKKKLIIEVFYEYFKIKQYGSVSKYCRQRRQLFKQKGYETLFLSGNLMLRLSESQIAKKLLQFHTGGGQVDTF